MIRGDKIGGKVATPIRAMLESKVYNGVAFLCQSDEDVETVRQAAIMLRKRNGYLYYTTKRGLSLVVYKCEDTEEPNWRVVKYDRKAKEYEADT